jgi:Glutaminase
MTETGGRTRFVSTGALPAPGRVRALGCVSGAGPSAQPSLRIVRVGTNGTVFAYGDAEHDFSIMSVSKPFVFALVCQAVTGSA